MCPPGVTINRETLHAARNDTIAPDEVMSLMEYPFSSFFPTGAAFALLGPTHPGDLLREEAALLPDTVTPERLREFTLGRTCAHSVLAALGPQWARFPVLRQGERLPVWPAGVTGAIAHAGGWAVAVAGQTPPFLGLGVDLERRRPVSERLWRRILRPEEQQQAARLTGTDSRVMDFLLRFSVKESVFKALYPRGGVYLGFQSATVQVPEGAWEQDQGELRWKLHQECGPDFPAGMEGVGGFQRRGEWVLAGVWVLSRPV